MISVTGFGEILKIFGNLLRVDLVFCPIFNLFRQTLHAIGENFIALNGQKSIHLVTLVIIYSAITYGKIVLWCWSLVAVTLLSCAECPEVFGRLRHDVLAQLEDDSAELFAVRRHVEVHLRKFSPSQYRQRLWLDSKGNGSAGAM